MKSLREYSLNISEKEYHELPYWSHSKIVKYANEGFLALKDIHKASASTPAMEFGSLFDCMITRPEDVTKEYVVYNETIPPAEKSVFDTLINLGYGEYSYDNLCSMHADTLASVVNFCESFCSKYKKQETRYAKLAENKEYYDIKRTGKKIISKNDWEDAKAMFDAFRANPYISSLFEHKDTDDVEYLYQTKFVVDYTTDSGKSVKIKIMPDLIKVDHKERTIQPVDLKTSSQSAIAFKESFVKFRYDIQASLYSDVLNVIIGNDDEYRDYTILPYLFVDISRTDKIPMAYEYPPYDESQIDGFSFKDFKYKSWQRLLDEMVNYAESDAAVPNGMTLDGPNSMLDILNGRL